MLLTFLFWFIFISIIWISWTWLFVEWGTHVSQNKDHAKENKFPYGYTNFNTFLKYFDEYKNWIVKDTCEHSLFSSAKWGDEDYNRYYIHAKIIAIDGKCMILYPISYIRFYFYIKNLVKEMNPAYKPNKIKY